MLTTWAFTTGIESGSLGEGAAVSLFLLPVLAIVAIGMLIAAKRAEVA
jgi:multiple sugar transport system permease protein